jgi:hypothetical protein
MFLPWTEPVSLSEGQQVSVDLAASLVENDYVWRWTTRIDPADGSGAARRFQQSQLAGAVISPARLHRSAADHVPQLSEDGRVNRRALELMDGKNSLEQIARRLHEEFPRRFTDSRQALSYVSKRSQEHSL